VLEVFFFLFDELQVLFDQVLKFYFQKIGIRFLMFCH